MCKIEVKSYDETDDRTLEDAMSEIMDEFEQFIEKAEEIIAKAKEARKVQNGRN